ncbi:MAG: beta-ketoacyl synthase chain length factor [Treponema sp.]|nr:beta-ketoacyl synthase chain length factor [Treponema sp.]
MKVSNTGGRTLYVSRFSSWAPGLSGANDWLQWAHGRKESESSGEAPSLDFPESRWIVLEQKEFSLFRRRQSQISRMTIHVMHEIMPIGEKTKTVFVSFRGEISQQYKINKTLYEEGTVSPAAFSQSVFNTPPALAAIALGLHQGYTAIYPAGSCFKTAFQAAAAGIFSGNDTETVLVYADELCPAEYGALCPRPDKPLAFAALLSGHAPGIPVFPDMECLNSPQNFLKHLYLKKDVS